MSQSKKKDPIQAFREANKDKYPDGVIPLDVMMHLATRTKVGKKKGNKKKAK